MMTRALFLDRDGVINKEINYLHDIEDVEFVDGIFDLCKEFQDRGFLIFIVTNQAGIARGYYSHNDFRLLSEWMVGEFSKHGILISRILYCPHHPEFSGDCDCRKPNPGMLTSLIDEYNIDVANSLLIGDKISDIEAGRAANLGLNVLVSVNELAFLLELFKTK